LQPFNLDEETPIFIKYVHKKTSFLKNTISNLYNNKATRIDYITIGKLCDLFDYIVGELLNREENS